MLKKIRGLFLGLMVLAGSACVTPTHASSASIVFTYIQAGSVASAVEEAVVLYNNSSQEIEVTGWCISNKNSVAFACFTGTGLQYVLPAYSYATVVSSVKAQANPTQTFSLVYQPTNQSSGSIVAGSDNLVLRNAQQELVDSHSWASGLTSSTALYRNKESQNEEHYLDTDMPSDWRVASQASLPVSQLEVVEIPDEPSEPEPEAPQETLLPIQITEILPNAVGSDADAEFIELYNPNSQPVSLDGYALLVGPALEKSYKIPTNAVLEPLLYMVIYNSELSFSLLNSSSRVALKDRNGVVVFEIPAYANPLEGQVWALILEEWRYTATPTPGAENVASLINPSPPLQSGDTQKPCAENQFRNPETGRCKLLPAEEVPKPCAVTQERNPETGRCRLIAAAAAPKPCASNQERNPETGRCRLIASATKSPAPCKEGQQRNAETNRCRTIRSLSKVDGGVQGATSEQQSGQQWYMWAALGGIILLAASYAVWEWRVELKALYQKAQARFASRFR